MVRDKGLEGCDELGIALTDVDNAEAKSQESMSTFRRFEFELEAVLLVLVYKRWTSLAVGIADSAQLHIIIKLKQVSCLKF